MIGDDQRHSMEAVHVAPEFSDRQLRLQQSLSSERSKSKDCFWTNQLKLPEQIRAAGGYFVGKRIAVSGRTVLEHVADENVFAREIDGRENLCEQLAGGTDERQAGFVLRLSGCLADDHELGVG